MDNDEGANQLKKQEKARDYVASKYPNWKIEELIYNKYKEV